ncbi:MAG: M20/M25/M40 family metallo-hydrolase [Clostridia bacterium]|nr:M20/M25/M40 family metallo-hydrolase [Clostridia bacterium]
MKPLDKDFKEYLDNSKKELTDLLFTLCAIPAPSGMEEKRAEFCRDWFKKNGGESAYIDDALNVVLPLGCDNDKPIICFMAHTDTVFPDLEPFEVKQDGDTVSCPGVGDDTACLVSLMIVARYFIKNYVGGKYGLLFVCNSCEEGLGNLKGSRKIAEDFGDRLHSFISIDGTSRSVCNRAVGSTRYKIKIKTEGGHSFSDFGNANAITVAAALITRLYQVEIPEIEDTRTTYNVGVISGGTSVNTIAEDAEFMYEYRSDSAEGLLAMEKIFDGIIEEFRRYGFDIDVDILGQRPGMGPVDPEKELELSSLCAEAIKTACGYEEVPFRSGSTDCNIPLSMGIPAACFGSYLGGGAHTRDEWISLSSIYPGTEAVALVVSNLASRE